MRCASTWTRRTPRPPCARCSTPRRASFARARPPPKEATVLTVLSTFKAPSFVPLPALPATAEGEGGYNQLTSFPEGLAAFAGVPLEEVRTPGVAER